MRALVLAVVGVALAVPAHASDRFAPGNPWFQQFEQTCRDGAGMKAECDGSVLGAYAEAANTTADKVTCDFAAFWRVKDTKHPDRIFAVLPWQNGVEELVATPGVCATK